MKNIENRLWAEAKKIPGGYDYSGMASCQLCFPLKNGGELRLIVTEEEPDLHIDFYDGFLPPGITGPVKKTG